jgi:pyruvate,water dikinase
MTMLPGYSPVGNICGRVYNNASVGASAFQALGRGHAFEASSKEMYGIDPKEIGDWDMPLLPLKLRDRFLVLRNVLQIMRKVRVATKSMDHFVATNPQWCQEQHRTLPQLEKIELHQWTEKALLPYLDNSFWWMVASAMVQSSHISRLRQELQAIAGPEDTIALLSNVSTQDETLASLGIVAGLDRLRRGEISREAYLQAYGHRGPHEVEMSLPRPAEDPGWIEGQLAQLERTAVDVDARLHAQQQRYENALQRLKGKAPRRFDALARKLGEAARLTRLREAVRSEVVRAMWVSRVFVQCAGTLCGLDEAAFFLEFEELMQLLVGVDEFTPQIPARKEAYAKFSALPQYPTLILGAFDAVQWATDPNRRTDVYDARGLITKKFTEKIQGSPGSAGQAEGRVRLLDTPEQGDQLQPGEILVAVTTNVGWTPLFPRLAAVVTDVGAPLSHAAIVARELGIPAVVGCFNATTLLVTGDRVRVDGARGTVEILEKRETR